MAGRLDKPTSVAALGAGAPGSDDFKVYTARPAVGFLSRAVQPPSDLYVQVGDALEVTACTDTFNEVITVSYRLLRPDGVLVNGQFIFPIAAAYTPQSFSEPLAEGFLLSLAVSAAQATTRGQTFVRAFLTSSGSGSGVPVSTLMADYVTKQMTPAAPNGRVIGPTEGPGVVYPSNIANPPIGQEFTIHVPLNARWNPLSVAATLITSGAAGNRNAGIRITQGTNDNLYIGSNLPSGPGTALRFYWMPGIQPYTDGSGHVFLPLPTFTRIISNFEIASTTLALQAGDQWSNIQFSVEEWLDNV